VFYFLKKCHWSCIDRTAFHQTLKAISLDVTLLEGDGNSISRNTIDGTVSKVLSARRLLGSADTSCCESTTSNLPFRPQTNIPPTTVLPQESKDATKLLQPARAALSQTHIKAFSIEAQTHNHIPHNTLPQKYNF
jgi:hypothetical protein